MKRNLSITTAAAALLIGTVFAAAQGVQRPGGGAGGAESGMQGAPGGAGGGAQMSPREGQGKGKAEQQPRTQGQGPGQMQREGSQVTPEGKGKAQSKEPRTQGQREQDRRETKGQREGQPQQGQRDTQQPKQGQREQREKGQRDTQQQGQRDNQKGADTKRGAQSGGVTLNAQQRTTIRNTVLRGGNAPRVSDVDFSISVGTVVPRRVRLVAVPPTLIEIHPAWRGHVYFVVGERIIIVEPGSHRIVAVLVV